MEHCRQPQQQVQKGSGLLRFGVHQQLGLLLESASDARELNELRSVPRAAATRSMRANLEVEMAINLLSVAPRCQELCLLSGSRPQSAVGRAAYP